jgi:hypothetical protein
MKYLIENGASVPAEAEPLTGESASTRPKAPHWNERRGVVAKELARAGYELMSGSGRSAFMISVTCFSFCPSMSLTDIKSETKLSSQTALSPS